MKKSELQHIIREEISKVLNEDIVPKIGSSIIQGILVAKSLNETPGKFYIEDKEEIDRFFAGKDIVATDRTNPDDEEGRWVNNKEYKYVTLLLK